MSGLEEELRDEGITTLGGTVSDHKSYLLFLRYTDHSV